MTDSPRVSVLMTVYNAAPWLREAVDSIVDQSFTDWELVVIENGSSDASPEILASYTDPRVRVVSVPENMGRTPALRHAFGLARGEYLAVLDADDVSLPRRLDLQVAYLDRRPDVVLVGGWVERIDEAGRPIGTLTPPTDEDALLERMACENPFVHSATMYRAADARAVGGYPETVPYAQDFGLWLRLLGRGKVGVLGEYLARHRSTPLGMTRSKESQVLVARDTFQLLLVARQSIAWGRSARRRNGEELMIAALRYALALARANRPFQALRLLARGISLHPRGILWNRVYRAALRR
jgi:glycosyltransferase involved in cell wall biosynthesis